MCMQITWAENEQKVLKSGFIKLTISLLNERKKGKWQRYNSLLAPRTLLLDPLTTAYKANKLLLYLHVLHIIIGMTEIILAVKIGNPPKIHLITTLVYIVYITAIIDSIQGQPLPARVRIAINIIYHEECNLGLPFWKKIDCSLSSVKLYLSSALQSKIGVGFGSSLERKS